MNLIERLMNQSERQETALSKSLAQFRGANEVKFLGGTFGGAVVISLVAINWIGIPISLITLMWFGMVYVYLSLGTTKANKLTAWAVCPLGVLASVVTVIALADTISWYSQAGASTGLLWFAVILQFVFWIAFGVIGLLIHQAIKSKVNQA